jgi:phosphonate metabolism protein (transferase hexapeptide repeat family)
MNAQEKSIDSPDPGNPAQRAPRLSSDGAVIHPGCLVVNSTFEAWTEVGEGSRVLNSTFEAYAYCDRLSDIANTTVGRFANIAAMTRIGPTDHPMANASLHHFLYRSTYYWDDIPDDADFMAQRASRRTVLGPDCWLGHGVIVKPEVTIGAGAVIASGAVVTKDVAPYMIMAGIPAQPLRPRFAPVIVDRLMALAWWNWTHERLRAALLDFRSLPAEEFLEKYQG